jgi:hypothetical protein
MKTTRDLDLIDKHKFFGDSIAIARWLDNHGMKEEAKHIAKMYTYQKKLIAEIRKLRKELKK